MTSSPDPRAERREKYHEADVVVVGAGIFGCAIAHALARQGRSVLLLERWMHEPDRIVGELLQPGGVAALRKLGLGHCLEGIDSIPCYGYDVIYRRNEVVIPYPEVDEAGRVRYRKNQLDGASVRIPRESEGRSFHHGRFIMELRKACMQQENITVVETEVVKTIRGEHTDQVLGVKSRSTSKETGEKTTDYFFGQLTIVADGYASKFREEYLKTKPVVRSKFYALEIIDCPLPYTGFGHVIIGDAFPVLLYQIGTHETRALIDVPVDLPEASVANGGVKGYIRKVVLPNLPEAVQPSVLKCLDDLGTKIPKSMPNSWLPPRKQTTDGLLILGDAMNMRHPLTGGGMTVAFNDAVLLAELLHPDLVPSLADHVAVRAAADAFHWRRKRLTTIINVLAQALYSLFAANDRHLRALQRGCFEYFQRGITEDALGLMGGMIHRPLVLAYHFFSVAFVAIWLNFVALTTGSWYGVLLLPVALVDAVLILWRASVVFLPVYFRELR